MHWSFTVAALTVLLVFTAIGSRWLTLGACAVVLLTGIVALPRERARGALAALVAAVVAAAAAVVLA